MGSISANVHIMYTNGNATPENALRELAILPYFTTQTLAKLTGSSANTNNTLLTRWNKSGRIIRLKRGLYTTQTFYTHHISDFDFIPSMSALINRLSYVSLEYVLQKHNILTEATYTISAVTTKKSTRVRNKLGIFYYKSIIPNLFAGYTTGNYHGIVINEDTLEKALFDYLYFRPLYGLLRNFKINLAEELRLNIDLFTPEQMTNFETWCKESQLKNDYDLRQF